MFLLYLSNLRFISTADTTATRYVPFSIVMRGRLDVDPWIVPYVEPYQSGRLPWGLYFAQQARGHWMSSYPVLTPVVVAPLYLPAALWLRGKGEVNPDQMRFYAEAMEKLSAALLAALSVAILYIGLRKAAGESPASTQAALAIALIYGAASATWNISSQALWLHGLTELSLALLLWALVSDAGNWRGAFWIGLALALAVANKPTNAVVALPLMVYFLWRHSGRWLSFLAPIATLGALVLGYNFYYFGNLTGGYGAAFRSVGYSGVAGAFDGNLTTGALGLLVSPSRGAIWFYPWIIFAIWGAVRMWREQRWPWSRFVVIGAVAFFLTYAKVGRWYGGYCFGPRYLADIMPLLAFFLLAVWPAIAARAALRSVLLATVLLAFGVQIVGVYFYPNGAWDSEPVSVDQQTARLWDWSDPEIVRTARAGPASSNLMRRLRGDYGKHP